MKRAWEKWKTFAEKIGNFQATVIFSILYFVLLSPVGIIVSLFHDFLGTRKFLGWQKLDDTVSTRRKMKEQ
ncbi:hypothetical protein CMO96_02970 [Candidatus Woesebacteria bacterium]|nr:hypothetical protein [Candidatus Woesebacteria bacterium]|tara:strand:- start:1304 stop:1516 length:213 start_codon:yes stop_codon:yes gene_type:complete